ncbi:hypothetical protein Kuja_0940 [Vibrio phage vB_VchM_Kuja]|uniref:Uncharacterized protein n=1 Tax=Vibrio phage vB_VchM_Kuja TaxID=2686437 RepID=A0A6B9J5H4_9CAUD|nr:hypothetical protein HWC83_gp142 [Vibrio phage vB_VchM_Kuja]QGZ16085.1 hypothetical protein Kuja_0940 [Vibrio phage vB_VchM_Kuja]
MAIFSSADMEDMNQKQPRRLNVVDKVELIGVGYESILDLHIIKSHTEDMDRILGLPNGVEHIQVRIKDVLFQYDEKHKKLIVSPRNSNTMFFNSKIEVYKEIVSLMDQWMKSLTTPDTETLIEVASQIAKQSIEQHLKIFTQSLIKLTDTLEKSNVVLSGMNDLAKKAECIRKDFDSIGSLFKD